MTALLPVHVAPAARPGHARVLLIAPHFPPGTGAGALRWEKLCAHLAEAGRGMDVITRHPEALPARDDARLRSLPPGTRVFAVRDPRAWIDPVEAAAWRVHRGARRALAAWRVARERPEPVAPDDAEGTVRESYAREELRWRLAPDELRRAFLAFAAMARDRAWAEAAAAGAVRDLDGSAYRAVITSGPPHMVHLAGASLSRRWRVAHVPDLRDPWSLVERLPAALASPVTLAVARRHERRVVRRAAAVVVNTELHRDALARLHPEHATRIATVMNGCDDDAPPPAPRSDRFVAAFAGTIYLDRDPGPLFEAAARFVAAEGLTPADFGLELMGTVHSLDGVGVAEMAARVGVGAYVRLHPPAPRRDALAFLATAALLVNLPQDSGLAIPSKVFEYMGFPAWLLALEEPGTATARLLAGTGADVVRPRDVAGIERVLRERFREFRAGVRPEPLAKRHERFTRRAQAARLIEVLERIGRSGPDSPASPPAAARPRRARAPSPGSGPRAARG